MIGTLRRGEVVEKVSRHPKDDAYHCPNLFQLIENEGASKQVWNDLMSHPFTTWYVKDNFKPYVQAVQKMTVLHRKDETFLDSVLLGVHKRCYFDKNKKKVHLSVVEVLLPSLLDLSHLSESQKLLRDVVLPGDIMSLLEANLIAKMSNYTSSLLEKARGLDVDQISSFYKLLCTSSKSKNTNRLLLRVFLDVGNKDVEKCAALLRIISDFRIYQISEDKAQDFIFSKALKSWLSTLSGRQYCVLATAVLPLNHDVVKIEEACLHCDDELLAQFFGTYQKLGALVEWFKAVLGNFSDKIELGDHARTSFITVSSKLTEQQSRDILLLLLEHLQNSIGDSTEVKKSKKRKVIQDSKMCTFMTDCACVLIAHSNVSLGDEQLRSFQTICECLDIPSVDSLKLWLYKASLTSNRTFSFKNTDQDDLTESQLELLIEQVRFSGHNQEHITQIFNQLDRHPETILSHCHVLYNHVSPDQMTSLAKKFLDIPILDHVIRSDVFSRLTDLHSKIVSVILGKLTDQKHETVDELTLASSRDIISPGSQNPALLPAPEMARLLDLTSQVPLTSRCYLPLLTLAWLLLQHSRGVGDPGLICRGVVTMSRFCRPPAPFTPLPAVLGRHSGTALTQLLQCSYPEVVRFIELFLSTGLSMSSVDLGGFVRVLAENPADNSEVVRLFVKELRTTADPGSRYPEEVELLARNLNKVLLEGRVSDVVKCDLVCAVCGLSGVAGGGDLTVRTHYDTLLRLLTSESLGLLSKVGITQILIDQVVEEEKMEQLVGILLGVFEKYRNTEKCEDSTDLHFTALNGNFVKSLVAALPNKAAEIILLNTTFETDLMESIEVPVVPISLIPKLINKLSKVQVINSITSGGKDAKLISRCLLCLAQHNYPIHLFNKVYNILLTLISSSSYSSDVTMMSNIVRTSEVLSKQRDIARHHAPYLLYTIFELISKGNSELLRDMTPAIHPLFEVCVVQGFQFLQTRLSPPARQLFEQLHGHFKDNVKYKGKT